VGRRGWILIVGAVLLMAAVTASLAPAPRETDDGRSDQPPPATRPPENRAPGAVRELAIDARRPATEEVARGTHVVLRVSVPSAGEVTVPGLGLTGFASPGTPAVFDLLAERTGRFDVMLEAAEGEPRRAGTLVVR
jgi:hypothetical protein